MAYKPINRPERMSHVQDALNEIVEQVVTSDDQLLESFEWE